MKSSCNEFGDINNQFIQISKKCFTGYVLKFVDKYNLKNNKTENADNIQKGQRTTLTSMIGFSVYLPMNLLDEFVKALLDDYSNNNPSAWIMYGYVDIGVRMCLDIDCTSPISRNTLEIILERFQSILCKHLPTKNKDIRLYTSKCGPRFKKGKLREGYHIVTNIRVNTSQSIALCNELKDCLKSDPDYDKYELDDSIYNKRNGSVTLRCPLTNKVEKCPLCTASTSQIDCDFCKGKNKVLSRFVYEPIDVNGNILPKNTRQLIRSHMLWSDQSDILLDNNTLPKNVDLHEVATVPNHSVHVSCLNDVITSKMKIITTQARLNIIRNVKILKDSICVNLNTTNCPYKKKTHNSSTLWIQINKRREMILRCRCKKYECCKKGSTVKHVLDSDIYYKVVNANLHGGESIIQSIQEPYIPTTLESKNNKRHFQIVCRLVERSKKKKITNMSNRRRYFNMISKEYQ